MILLSDETCCNKQEKESGDFPSNGLGILVKRMNRIEGQIKGIKNMMTEETYCDDILHQISAARAALDSISRVLLENHINTYVIKRLRQDDPDIVNEFLTTVSKITK
ncbi:MULTISPECIES: metal-sensing transcriptional repressor [Staphylococcus]|uniref:Repressor CsoR of the copZA operon n=1 Tax=Staphylococcus cohnii subsp. cohnii TaxID=74704 RepID=A0A0M2NRR6_STACC|nr:metal-sensing transcriptional repressor [Staphylococcus cohnii]KKI62727.1 Repressor CsoR of the copZA operon [Staphylococcus cohnii subsp. cohnii]MDW4327919.1 metal-sensing transcriptional repressor [Staphylococcus saprophyticus]